MGHTSILSVGEVALFVHETGEHQSDVPPLLVIHGGPDWDHSYLLPGLDLVAQTRRVVAFDIRGCGRSTGGLGPQGYQPEFVVQDVERLICLLGHERVDLLGFSTGGQVAQLFVEAHPERVRRLVLASTTAYPDVGKYLEGWAEYESGWLSWLRGPIGLASSGGILATMLMQRSRGRWKGPPWRSGILAGWMSTSACSPRSGSPVNGCGLSSSAGCTPSDLGIPLGSFAGFLVGS